MIGRLTVIERAGANASGNALWLCRCDCGRQSVVEGWLLRKGQTRSCGCLIKESCTKHGMSKSPEYRTWAAMLTRCTNPNSISYPNYGGRGIKVCARWRTFENFYADMGPKPSPTHSIDRINNDGNYEPGNCRWATRVEQNVNQRRVHLLTFNGSTMSVSEWANRIGITVAALCNRLERGWSIERALTARMKPHQVTAYLNRKAAGVQR